MAYEKCAEVSQEIWGEVAALEPQEVTARTGAVFRQGLYYLPFLNHQLIIDPTARQVQLEGARGADPGFRACLTALLYLRHIDIGVLGPPLSPLEMPGGTTFFQARGPHSLPAAPLEARFGKDAAGFLAAGGRLDAEPWAAGDAAMAFTVFPGLRVGVILWQADEEFPAQVSFTVPAHLDRFWHLDAVLGLLDVVTRELLKAADH